MTPWSCPRCRLPHLLVQTASSPRCSKCEVPLERAEIVLGEFAVDAIAESVFADPACDQEHGELATTCAECRRWICLSCKEPCPANKAPRHRDPLHQLWCACPTRGSRG
jgi:hypothetical protein